MHSQKRHPQKLPLTIAATLLCLASPILHKVSAAHQVKVTPDVGATLHIEPNDTPRAGEEALAWFALTRSGGRPIALSECDCELAIYQQQDQPSLSETTASTDSQTPDSQIAPVLTPALSPITTEGYEGIPGASFTFPAVGIYSLVLSGAPKQADSFDDFTLAFDVTVAAGQASSAEQTSPTEQTSFQMPQQGNTTNAPSPLLKWIALGMGGAIVIGVAAVFVQRSQQKP
ncbi:MAG: hypothetical protein WBC73_12135 [Phormidesmis sp.]